MSSPERAPLLPTEAEPSNSMSHTSLETTPLLADGDATLRYDGESSHDRDEARSVRSQRSIASTANLATKRSRRWPSIIAMAFLALLSIAIIIVAFFVPAAVEEYAKEAAVLEPTNLSIESITASGVRARIQANFRLDGSRVRNEHVRRVGRITTWLVRQLGTEETRVSVYLPEYGNILLGTANVPPLAIDIVDGHRTTVDVVAELTPGEAEGIRTIANEWLDGRLDLLRITARADIQLKSGIVPLGSHAVAESLTFEAQKLPSVPTYNITRLNFEDVTLPGREKKGLAADVSLSSFNKYPVQLDIPGLGFEILVPNCAALSDPYIMVADATTSPVAVRPQSDVAVDVHGLVRELPDSLTSLCPDSRSSPLDLLLKRYMNGEPATLFVRGKKESPGTPPWIGEIASSVTVPVPFPGRQLDGLIRDFSLTDVRFALPDPDAEPGEPDADAAVSGTIVVTARLPSEMNFDINVTEVRATADVLFHDRKLGVLNLDKYQEANSTRIKSPPGREATLKVQSRIEDAPLTITDGDVFSDVIQALITGRKTVMLDIQALVDVKVWTVLGELELKKIPAAGTVPVKPLPQGAVDSLAPQVGGLRILDTTYTSITLEARVNITNPTPYAASIPSVSVYVVSNGSVVGEAWADNLVVSSGNNTGLRVGARWNPAAGGDEGAKIGRDLLSQYLSGHNVSVTFRAHRDSIPRHPLLGEALSKINITVRAPRLRLPGDDEGDSGHFIRDATFHVFSSTAAFTLVSPLSDNTLYIEHINATALYNHTEHVGRIVNDVPFAAPPGTSQTPRLPVDWSLGSVGFDKLRKAIGGDLKLDAKAVVRVRLGNWKETVWYIGRGIGAHIRP